MNARPLPFPLSPRLPFLPLLAAVILIATGCTVTRYGEFSRVTFGTKTSVPHLIVDISTNGAQRIELRGYSQDAAEALGIVAERAAQGAVKGLRP